MCPIQFREDGPPHGPPAFMDFALFERIIADLPALRDLHLQGLGEPMMHPRFFDMVECATNRGIRVTTSSNLTLLNERRAERAVSSGLDTIHVSIDAASPELYARIRVRSRLDRVSAGLARLLAARAARSSRTPHLRLTAVVMRQNLHELPDLVRLAHRWSFESMFVQHLAHDFGEDRLPARYRPMRRFVEEQTLLNEDAGRIERYFGQARQVAGELGIELRLPRVTPTRHPPGTPGSQRCDWPWRGAYLSYQGLAMPCCMIATPDRLNFGSVAAQSIQTVWSSSQYERFREQLASEMPPDVCESCSVYTHTF